MTQTDEFATRFLRVFDAMAQLAKHQMPDDVVGQLNLKQLLMMHLLHKQPGASQKEISEHFAVTAAAISTAVRDMENLELIERVPDPADARQMCLYLSHKGKEIVMVSQQKRREGITRLLSVLSLEEQQTIVEILERAIKTIHEKQSLS